MVRRSTSAVAGVTGLSLAFGQPAGAHGLGSRTDLPLPLWMFTYGAAAALLISFAGLAVFWRSPRLEGRGIGRVVLEPGPLARGLILAGRSIALGLFVLLFIAAAFGDPDTVENIAPVFVYVVFWVGLTLICALVGDLWRVVNPFDTLAALVERLAGPDRPLAPYRFGRWPAVAGLSGFVWLELVYPYRAEPRTLAVAIGVYTVAVLLGVLRWGRGWLRQVRPSPPSSTCWPTWPRSTPMTKGGSGCGRRCRVWSASSLTPPPKGSSSSPSNPPASTD